MIRLLFLSGSLMMKSCDPSSRMVTNDLSFWTVGSSGVEERFCETFYESLQELEKDREVLNRFLLTLALRPLSEAEIVHRSRLAESRVRDLVEKLGSMGVIEEEDGLWKTTLPVVADPQMKRIKADIRPMTEAVAGYFRDALPRLRTAYVTAKSPGDPCWTDAAHLMVDKFIIDGPFHRNVNRLQRERSVRTDPPDKPRVIPAFFLEQGEHFSTFGTNWYKFTQGGGQREVYVLHGGVMDRFTIPMNAYRGDAGFASILFQITRGDGLSNLTIGEKNTLEDLGWIIEDRLLVPIIEANTIRSLFPLFDEIGREAAETAAGDLSILDASFRASPYARFLEHDDDYRQVCIHTLFSSVIERLVDEELLPPIPDPVPDHFAVFLVKGRLF